MNRADVLKECLDSLKAMFRRAWKRYQAYHILPEDLPEADSTRFDFSFDLNLSYSYDKFLITQVIDCFNRGNFTHSWLTSEADSKPGNPPRIVFRDKDSYSPVYVTFHPTGVRSTCKQVQIGVEVREIPIYEFVCEDEAVEVEDV